jgi:hypothetical protein
MGAYERYADPKVFYADDDAEAGGDGLSWDSAFGHLQDALDVVIYGDQIWLGSGVYRPDSNKYDPAGSGDRNSVFALGSGVSIKGGFAGVGAGDPNARDIIGFESILSADLAGDDEAGFTNYAENSYHVVSCNDVYSGAVLEGLTIRGGLSDDRRGERFGGGLYLKDSSVSLVSCHIMNNWAFSGGGAYCIDSQVLFVNCIFSGNFATGGGAVRSKSGHCTFVNCTLTGNEAMDFAGLYSTRGGAMEVVNSIFWNNKHGRDSDEEGQVYGEVLSISYSCLEGWTGGLGGVGNTGADPLFVQTGHWDESGVWFEGDYHLSVTSSCIDTGNVSGLAADVGDIDNDGNTFEPVPLDAGGQARVLGGSVDMGSFESYYPTVECAMRLTPRVVKLGSRGKYVKAHIVLSEGYVAEDVDMNQPCMMVEPFEPDIESENERVFVNEQGYVEVEAAFARSAFCSAGSFDGVIAVAGKLTNGMRFVGTDSIRVMDRRFE